MGAKPQVIRFNDETAISLWACGAIVCIGRGVMFIEEDDGNWFSRKYIGINNIDSDYYRNHPKTGMQSGFSLGWGDSFISAFQRLNEYVKENGEPYYYAGTDTICGYELKKKN